jgi:endonuclease/exonuclease/phosphatase family metal-dependent hydrolase
LTDGGGPQLWTSAVGLTGGLVWLSLVAGRGTRADVRGLVLGLALGTVLHGTLGAEDLVWRSGVLPALASAVLAAAFVATTVLPADRGGPVGGRVWPLALPAVLLWGVLSGSPAVASVAVSYAAGAAQGYAGIASSTGVSGLAGALAVKALVAAAVAVFVGGALAPPSPALRWAAAVALPLGVLLAVAADPVALPAAMLLSAAGLGGCLAAATGGTVGDPGSRARRGYSPALGGIGMAVAAVLYYAAYDLGFPNEPVLVAVAVVVALVAVTTRPRTAPAATTPAATTPAATTPPGTTPPGTTPAGTAWRWAAVAGVAALLLVDGGRWGPVAPPAGDPGQLRVVAYNVRMGFGLDGRFDPDALAAVVAAERPDVVLLSEVDRGWLLNGGHDDLAVLGRRLGLPTLFAPAADAVWGDALLTRLPVATARTVVLPPAGAPTGAQALGAVLRAGSREIAVVSTHLQPPPGGAGPVEQARAVAAFAADLGAGGRPVIVGGDLNTEPGDPAFGVLVAAGLRDALAAARPLPTSPADEPARQIDHVLVTPGLTPSAVVAPRSTASDHLAVAVTLALPGQTG